MPWASELGLTQKPPQQPAGGSSQSSQPEQQQPTAPDPKDWDYKTSEVNLKGETLPAGAQSWTPFGDPYFGKGISGTLKRYAWTMMGNPNGQNDDRWTSFLELTESNSFWNDPTSKEFKQGVSEFTGGVFGTDKNAETAKTDWNKVKQANARMAQISQQYKGPNGVNLNTMPSEVRAEYEDLQKTIKGGTGSAIEGVTSVNGISLLSPLVKGSKVAIQAALDVLSEVSVKLEQAQGTVQAVRDYADEKGSPLPGLAFDIDRTQGERTEEQQNEFWNNPIAAIKSEEAQSVANLVGRLAAPALVSWDALRFWTAPGTMKEKQQAIADGWDAGRILYSQTVKPALLEEYKRRAAAGEDPQLLAMELANPWAEGIGQAILDPLNVIGAFSKGAKAANMLDNATDAARGGSLGDEAAELLADAGRTPLGETAAADRMTKFDDLLTKNVERIESQRLTVDYNKATAYSPSGLRIRESKVAQTVSNVVTSSIMRNGGTTDDVADFFHLMTKSVSLDKTARMDAWDQIMSMSKKFGLGRYPFSDDVLETGVILRNLMEDKELLPALKAGKGDLFKTAEILNNKLRAGIEKQILNYGEVKTLAEKFAKGEDVSKQAEKAAQTYKGIKNKALWNLHDGTLGKAKNAINATLAKFYFSQPGFAARNFQGNFVTMFVDSGLKGTVQSYFKDGKFWSISAIDEDLGKWFGGKLPPSAGGVTMLESEQALTGISKLSDNIEKGFAKRIYHKNFRETMDKFMTPGVALPKRDEFKALGMTDEGIDHFVHILKNEAYGNVDNAMAKYAEKFGDGGLLDAWKRWNGSVTKEEMSGLTEMGLTKEIDDIVSSAKTPQEIREKVNKLRRELTNRANSATDNPVGVNRERKGFEFIDGIGKATQQGMMDVDGTNKLNILIEKSEQATEELMAAIGKARDTVQDPALRQQFSVMEEAFSATRRGTARTTSQQLTDTAWDFTKRSKNATGVELARMWDQSILAKHGPPPTGLTAQQFRDELWQATRSDVSNNWEVYFSEGFDRLTPLIDSLTEQYPELSGIFQKSQKASAELNIYRTATYRDGKIFYSQPPKNVRELASRYGIATASAEGVPQDRQLLATINKYADQKYKSLDDVPLEEAEKALEARRTGAMTQADAARVEQPKAAKTPKTTQPELAPAGVTMEEATQIPRGELPPEVSTRFEDEARRLLDELNSGTGPTVQQPRQGTDAFPTTSTPSTNADWYRELPKSLQNKKVLNTTLEKIIKDKGSDKGVNVERLKELIIDRFRYGSEGAPPDIKVLKGLGADDKVLQSALDDYNDFTKQNLTLEQVLGSAPASATDEAVAVADDANMLAPDPENPYGYYDDEGNLITPTDELGEIRNPTPNPEVEIAPPYVDGSTPIPGQMWKESSDGALAALGKVERYMLDNYGMKAAEKLEGGQIKALSSLMKDSRGRITEGMAIADRIGKEWRDFTLLPYGETKNFDLALSYAFPYQFWYSRSYANWGKRVATDPQVIANYARIKETMSQVNKDSPEWWRYNVEIPSHFLGLPNENPMSFNLEANIWPLYGLTGTDFNDPQKRQNWFTATVDDMGKMGPSLWAPIQWAIALGYKAQGEDELAQAFGGRVIPQTSTIKAVSSYFGQPVELDPGVQLFSGKGIMDFGAMDKYERNRVGRALTSMVQSGELTQEQAVEIARTQEGPAWDEAVKRATQIRAPGAISSFFLGVGMKARTEEDRITDEFYQQYYRVQNLNEAGLISPRDYQKAWDGLREQYPFMDALLLSRKAGPDRDRAYAYNVLGRIPPGQAGDLYKLVGIDPKTAQKFYDSKGDIKNWPQSERERFTAAMVDLGAMLAIPDTATKSDWNDARNGYKQIQEGMKQTFGADIQDKIDELFSLEDKDARDRYIQTNPQVSAALQWQNEQVVSNEEVYAYYGGLQALEKFHKGKVFDTLEAKYGADIQAKFDEYYQMQIADPTGAKKYYKQHPELKAYNEEKTKLMDQALRQIVEFGARLPDTPKPELTGNAPESVAQQNIADYATQSTPDFGYWQGEMPEVSAVLASTWQAGEAVPYAVKKNLDYRAQQYGYQSGDDLLQAILISMQR